MRYMSQPEALSRLTVKDRRREVIKLVLLRAIDGLKRATAVVAVYGLAAPTAAQVSDQPAAAVYSMTPERLAASTATVVGLLAAIIGGLGLLRSVRRVADHGRRAAIAALMLGPIALVIGGLVVATADGGVGTGNGVAGGVVAMMLGIIGTALGGLALARLPNALARRRAGNVVD
jgi:Family of unknown function (DUF6223)